MAREVAAFRERVWIGSLLMVSALLIDVPVVSGRVVTRYEHFSNQRDGKATNRGSLAGYARNIRALE